MKNKYLFYWEEAVDSFIPVPDQTENMVSIDNFEPGDEIQIRFKCMEMTEAEFKNLPEV